MRRFLKAFLHLFGHAGHVEHETDSAGTVWVGLRCHHCGKLVGPVRSPANPEASR